MMSPAPRPRHQFIGVLLGQALNEVAVSIGGIALASSVDVDVNLAAFWQEVNRRLPPSATDGE
jgi:hypothetical protein